MSERDSLELSAIRRAIKIKAKKKCKKGRPRGVGLGRQGSLGGEGSREKKGERRGRKGASRSPARFQGTGRADARGLV